MAFFKKPLNIPSTDTHDVETTRNSVTDSTQPSQLLTEAEALPPVKDVPRTDVIRLMIGFLNTGMMWAMPFFGVIGVLLPQRFVDIGLSSPTSMIARINAVGAFVAVVANIVFGMISDRSRSRFGKRTPFIVLGSAFAGVFLFLTFTATAQWLILLYWALFQLGLNAMLGPFLAVLSDRVPDAERAKVSAAYGFGVMIAQAVGIAIASQFIMRQGIAFALFGVLLAVSGVVTVLIWPREPSAHDNNKEPLTWQTVAQAFKPPSWEAIDFYRALLGRLLIMMGYYMISSYQLYLFRDYIGLDTEAAARSMTILSMCVLIPSIVSMLVAAPLSDMLGRRKPLVIVCAVIISIGIMVPFIWPTTMAMYVYAGCAGFGFGIYMTVDQALNVDVLPNKADAGKDLGILNLSNTVGQILGPIVTSLLFGALASYTVVFPLAAVICVLSVIFIARIESAR